LRFTDLEIQRGKLATEILGKDIIQFHMTHHPCKTPTSRCRNLWTIDTKIASQWSWVGLGKWGWSVKWDRPTLKIRGMWGGTHIQPINYVCDDKQDICNLVKMLPTAKVHLESPLPHIYLLCRILSDKRWRGRGQKLGKSFSGE
jgi:hypothetical protein